MLRIGYSLSHAYQTLTKMCPDKSVRPTLRRKGDIYMAQWKRPDGKKAYALWTSKGKEFVSLLTKGKYECFDINGRIVPVLEQKVEVSPSILYFVGGRKFEMTIGE